MDNVGKTLVGGRGRPSELGLLPAARVAPRPGRRGRGPLILLEHELSLIPGRVGRAAQVLCPTRTTIKSIAGIIHRA